MSRNSSALLTLTCLVVAPGPPVRSSGTQPGHRHKVENVNGWNDVNLRRAQELATEIYEQAGVTLDWSEGAAPERRTLTIVLTTIATAPRGIAPESMGVDELKAIREKHATPRMTDIVPDEGEIAIEDLIANEGVIITITHAGLIKRTNVSSYRSQRRGGKGVIGMATREGSAPDADDADFIEHLFTASTHDYLMFFTSTGRVYTERVHEIPDMGRASKGRSIANLLELRADEKIASLIRVQAKYGPNKEDQTWSQPQLFCATQQGIVKKTALEEFSNIRKGGIIAIKIEEGDILIDVKMTNGHDEVVLITVGA